MARSSLLFALGRSSVCREPADQTRQLSHVVEYHGGARGAQGVAIAGPAMAAAVKAEHRHAGGSRACYARQAVLDHEASLGRYLHLLGGKQKQVRCRLASLYLGG